MAELKIITHTTYNYQTTDGREFTNKTDAEAWQKSLDTINDIIILDSSFKSANHDITFAYYLFIKDEEQYRALRLHLEYYFGPDDFKDITGIGYWYYDNSSDTFKNLDKNLNWLQKIKSKLDEYSSEGGHYV